MPVKTTPRRNSERREESSQRIIEAAITLFAEKGYQRTTLIQIGERAGCTGTLVSNRFGNKERVLRAVLATILNRFQGQTLSERGANEDLSATEQLSRFVALYLKDVVEQQTRIRALYVLMGESLGGLPQIAEEIQRVDELFRAEVEAYLQIGVDAGEFEIPKGQQLITSTLIVGLLRGVATQVLNAPNLLSLDELVENTQVAVKRMIGAGSSK
ncbi:TetR family transcriptional regulator [Sneathiella sp. P13V-1]|uniref:TetR/AcrR family transcriptional regulator n=1 Tax=Sneathiella sp. P13V-1 TaxID=2697366 RepID=UPI00187B8724|nr:TetR/AcrR family transcriptional regulator [Sneathiella sp. P13V-1]MBE7638350.1 TetR family transcriptional regulator [Sneathiella sp. P13V-1]